MNPRPLLLLTAAVAALLGASASAQRPGEKPLSESDLLKQIEAIAPSRATVPGSTPTKNAQASSGTLFDTNNIDLTKSGNGDKGADKGEKKAKGPTEITALEATFDQKANLAVFIGEVVVKDPEFNVICDKLTAHLKHDDKTKPKGAAAATPKPATPAATPAGKDKDKKSGGLEKAVAESTSDRRVIITQDKTGDDGTVTHSVGKADKATYDAVTGDIVLYGSPDVIQNTNRVQATDPGTVMTLNRDGHMKAVGPHKTTIVDKGDGR